MLLKIGIALYRCFWQVLMSILCLVMHVLCVCALKLLSDFFWLFWVKIWLFWWRQVGDPVLNADILADNAARQWLLIAVSHAVLYCVERSQSESIAMQPQVWNIHCWCSVKLSVTNVPEWIALIQCGPTIFYLRAISQKRDNLRATSGV